MKILAIIRRRLKLFSILSSLLFLVPTSTSTLACAFGPEDEELRYMILNPDLLHNKSWWSFFYNRKLLYLDGVNHGMDDYNQLADEWLKEMNVGTVGIDEAVSCLFGSLADSVLKKNSFYLEIKKRPALFTYFETALKCAELTSLGSLWDGWKAKDPAELSALRTEKNVLLAEWQRQTDPFLKKKYAFQLIKLAYYDNDTQTFDKIYKQNFAVPPHSVLDWWVVHYKSMVLERQGKVDSANFLHALVFAHSSDKMVISERMFSVKNLNTVLALAQNDEDRADVLTLASVINPGRALETLMKVYRLSPRHKNLPLLISREANKLEDWIGSTSFNELPSYYSDNTVNNLASDKIYLKAVIDSISSMHETKTAHPAFYNLSLASLQLLNNDGLAAGETLNKIKVDEPEALFEVQVLRLIQTVQTKDITRDDVQNDIGVQYEKLLRNRMNKFESQRILLSLSSWLRYSFANKDLIHLAGLFDNYAVNKFCYSCKWSSFTYSLIGYFDQYASIADIEKLVALYDKPVKNKLEEVLLYPYSNKNYFYDVLSVKNLREGNTEGALKALRNIPPEFWDTYGNALYLLDRDPFTENDELMTSGSMKMYTKAGIVAKMVELEKKIVSGENRSENAIQLANAWYNFSAHSWFMISYRWTLNTTESPQHALDAQKTALKYYRIAGQYETNQEKQAKIRYMIALLDPRKESAKAYELSASTEFYHKKNCLTTQELAK